MKMDKDTAGRGASGPYEQERQLLESILATVPGYIHVYNLKKKKLSYNNSGALFFGHDLLRTDNPARAIAQHLHPDSLRDGVAFLRDISRSTGNEEETLEFRIRRKDGRWAYALLLAKPFRFDAGGELEEIIAITQDITEKKEQEMAFQQSQQMLEMAVEGAKLGIWEWDVEHKLVTYSNRFLEQLGYNPAKFSNQFGDFVKLLHPEDIPRMTEEFKAQTSQSGHFEFDYRLLASCGSYHWIYDRGYVVERWKGNKVRKAIGISIDITQRKEAEIRLQESEAIQHAILNALPDLKFRMRADGVFLDYFASPGETSRLFAQPRDFLGKSVREVMPEYICQAVMGNLRMAIEQGATQAFEYLLVMNGETYFYEARISAINEQEAMVVVRDISALKHARQELQDKVWELDQNNQKLRKYVDSNSQLENFAHTVSHDLREPIRTIHSFSQLLQKKYHGQLDEQANTFLDFIASSASSMNDLIEGLLNYSRFSNSTHQATTISIEHLLQSVTNTLNELISEQQATIYLCTPPPTIRGNWTKISQLFQNLLSNAIKFRTPGRHPVVEIFAWERPEQWAFAVRDNGIGISQEYHHQIFLLFRRLHSRRQYPGSGIGLSLCKRMAEQHGGKIWVESQPGRGATFYFTLSK